MEWNRDTAALLCGGGSTSGQSSLGELFAGIVLLSKDVCESFVTVYVLFQITKLVPDLLPPKGWYVVLNSAICLHSMLTHLQTILDLTRK